MYQAKQAYEKACSVWLLALLFGCLFSRV